MSNNKLYLPVFINSKLLLSTIGIILLIVIIKLFTHSTHEKKEDEKFHDYFNQSYKIFALNIPRNLTFAGEKVPTENFEVSERLDRELLINTYWQSQTLLFIKRANRWFPVIEPILEKNGVPDDFKYLALIESGFMNVVSPAGATGYWQFMKTTARKYNLEINGQVDERYHVEKSTEAACKYLKDAKRILGSWTLAAGAYNAGIGGIRKQLSRQKAKNYYDLLLISETSRYLFRILAFKEIFSDPKKYGFHLRMKDLYPTIDTYEVKIDSSIADFADFAAHFDINYKTLKVLNPWLRDNFLTNKQGKKYRIKIPKAGATTVINRQSIFKEDQLEKMQGNKQAESTNEDGDSAPAPPPEGEEKEK